MLAHPYLGWLGILLKWFCDQRLVLHSHNIESLRFKSMGKWWWSLLWHYEKFVHRKTDINFFITNEDKAYAIKHFGLKEKKCFVISYGIEINTPPSAIEKANAKAKLKSTHQIQADETIILFNGALDYKPNSDAVNYIINDINPVLIKNSNFKYKIIICGKGLPESFKNLDHQKNVIYAGFVDDISLYFKGADIFINPVIDGGGIKTKLVEALGNDLYSVSTVEGAFGIPEHTTNNRLKIVETNNWELFAENIMNADFEKSHINGNFFDYFYWGKIAEKAKNAIESL